MSKYTVVDANGRRHDVEAAKMNWSGGDVVFYASATESGGGKDFICSFSHPLVAKPAADWPPETHVAHVEFDIRMHEGDVARSLRDWMTGQNGAKMENLEITQTVCTRMSCRSHPVVKQL